MNRNNKKRLYESIMRSVSKTIKHKLNEDANGDSSFDDIIYSLANKIRRLEDRALRDRLPAGLFNLINGRIAIMGDDSEYFLIDTEFSPSCPYSSVDELTAGVYMNYNYDVDAHDNKEDRKWCNFLRKQLKIIVKKLLRMIANFDCEAKFDEYMLFIKYKGELNTNEDLKIAITSLAKIELQIDSYFAEMFA